MVHAWETMHVVVTVQDKDTGQISYLDTEVQKAWDKVQQIRLFALIYFRIHNAGFCSKRQMGWPRRYGTSGFLKRFVIYVYICSVSMLFYFIDLPVRPLRQGSSRGNQYDEYSNLHRHMALLKRSFSTKND